MTLNPVSIAFRNPTRIFIGLILFELLLVAIYFGIGPSGGLPPRIYELFDLDGESNIPSLFSSLQLLAVSGMFFLTGRRESRSEVRPSRQLLWLGALLFLYLSLDEAVGIHEAITRVARHTDWMPASGFKGGRGVWIYPYLFACMILAAAVFRWKREELYQIWKSYRLEVLLMLSGAGMFLFGAVGLEILSFQFLRDDLLSFAYRSEVAAEEFLEMAGISLILYSVLLFDGMV